MTTGATRREILVTRLGWGLAAVSLAALGVVWGLDRTRVREAPRWDPARFVALAGGAPAPGAGVSEGAETAGSIPAVRAGPASPAEVWAVAVNPECPSCLASLRAARAVRDRERSPLAVVALVVDTPQRPAPQVARALAAAADGVWWDRENRWRRRWGHRVYGEVLCFGPDGALLRVLGPLAAEDGAR
uniref:Redoxin domain-containing protein n=1 Tax=Eiseniibacteriota bacterium TaxID=2212470 RepID=A0A832MLK1_UNCEI